METSVKKPYNPANYEYATVEDYGYIDYKPLQVVWNVIAKILVVFSIIMLYFAVILIAIQSFNSSDSTTEFASFTFANYANMFGKKTLNQSIFNTFKVSIISTAIATFAGTLIAIGAYFLPKRAKSALTLLNNIPLLNADIVTGVSLMIIFAFVKQIFGITYLFGFWTILIAHIYFILPYIVLSVLPKMKEIDPNMLEASLDLGVKPFKSLIKVLIPAIKGGIFAGMILAFTISFEDFVVGYFTNGNGYNTLSIWIYTSIGKKSLFPGVYAFSTALTLLMIVGGILYSVLMKGRGSRAKKSS